MRIIRIITDYDTVFQTDGVYDFKSPDIVTGYFCFAWVRSYRWNNHTTGQQEVNLFIWKNLQLEVFLFIISGVIDAVGRVIPPLRSLHCGRD